MLTLQDWKNVLGENLFYHFGAEKNVLEGLYPFIPVGAKVLDCGCGFGGPARALIKKLNCKVTGITNLPDILPYITDFPVLLDDLESFTPDSEYDIALFLDSITHLSNNTQVLQNLYSKVNKILIRDFVSEVSEVYENWDIRVRTKEEYFKLIKQANYKIINYKEIDLNITETSEMWAKNLIKSNNYENKQFKFLKDFCNYWDSNKKTPFKTCIIYAIK